VVFSRQGAEVTPSWRESSAAEWILFCGLDKQWKISYSVVVVSTLAAVCGRIVDRVDDARAGDSGFHGYDAYANGIQLEVSFQPRLIGGRQSHQQGDILLDIRQGIQAALKHIELVLGFEKSFHRVSC
jgi:hypothetical protein